MTAEQIAAAYHWLRILGEEITRPNLDLVLDRMDLYWQAYVAHPDYAWCQRECPRPPHHPPVVGAWQHTPGIQGRTESYLISDFEDLTCEKTARWALRMWHGSELVAFLPVRPDWPLNPYRMMCLSNLPSAGYAGRMELKRLLPGRFHKYISLARSRARMRHPDSSPEMYAALRAEGRSRPTYTRTKAEAFVADDLPPVERNRLALFVDPLMFYRAATGQIPAAEIAQHISHQLALDI